MASTRSTTLHAWLAAGTVSLTVAACSSGPSPSLTVPPLKELSTRAGTVLTISPGQLLAATNGVTPVAFGKPAHGSIAYGAYGAMIYTPDAGFTGTDQVPVTVSHAVRLYAEDETPLLIVGEVAVQAAPTKSMASLIVARTSTGAPPAKRCFRYRLSIRRSPSSNSATASRRWSRSSP
jgi:hypothetical protein